jgi:predicted metal-dependent phosphoesterase TrpH
VTSDLDDEMPDSADAGQRGRADLHIHSRASDGVSSVAEILGAAESIGLDVIAITDHDRIEAAVAARALAEARGTQLEVILGEEISTRGGHVLGLFIEQRIRPWQSLRSTVAQIHEQGGLAIIAHPLVPYPLCASGRSIRRLLAETDVSFHPDGMEAFNPTTARMVWSRKAPDFARETGLAPLANSDAHRAEDIGSAITTFPGATAADLRAAILAGTTDWEGSAYTWRAQVSTFGQQMAKRGRYVLDDLVGSSSKGPDRRRSALSPRTSTRNPAASMATSHSSTRT